jgi:hypothetical protein
MFLIIFALFFYDSNKIVDAKSKFSGDVVAVDYEDVTVFYAPYDSTPPPEDWRTFCFYPYFCFGLLCDQDEIITDDKKCVKIQDGKFNASDLKWPSNNIAYLYFNPQNEEITTIQRYGEQLMNSSTPFTGEFELTDLIALYYDIYTINYGIYYYYRYESALFVAFKNTADGIKAFVQDYKCSYQYALKDFYKVFYTVSDQHNIFDKVLYTSCTLLVTLIIVILVFPELRSTLNGKCVLIYLVLDAAYYFTEIWNMTFYRRYFYRSFDGAVIQLFFRLSACLWLNIVCYDTFQIIRYN